MTGWVVMLIGSALYALAWYAGADLGEVFSWERVSVVGLAIVGAGAGYERGRSNAGKRVKP